MGVYVCGMKRHKSNDSLHWHGCNEDNFLSLINNSGWQRNSSTILPNHQRWSPLWVSRHKSLFSLNSGDTYHLYSKHDGALEIWSDCMYNDVDIPFLTNYCVWLAVPPLIRTEHPSVSVANGSSVVLECDVEAYPESLCYWERADGRSIDSVHKAFLRDQGKYKVTVFSHFTKPHEPKYLYVCGINLNVHYFLFSKGSHDAKSDHLKPEHWLWAVLLC